MGFGHEEESVDEALFEHRFDDGDDNDSLVDIGGEEVEVVFSSGALPDDIVLSGQDAVDDGGMFVGVFDIEEYLITDADGVSEFDIIESDFADHTALPGIAIGAEHLIPASGRFDDGSCCGHANKSV